jgi:hypothetical protein
LNPNKSKAIQREESKDGQKVLLTEDDGTSREYLELMSPYATNRQAIGRYYDMIIILMLFVMLYCIYRTGEVQHA